MQEWRIGNKYSFRELEAHDHEHHVAPHICIGKLGCTQGGFQFDTIDMWTWWECYGGIGKRKEVDTDAYWAGHRLHMGCWSVYSVSVVLNPLFNTVPCQSSWQVGNVIARYVKCAFCMVMGSGRGIIETIIGFLLMS